MNNYEKIKQIGASFISKGDMLREVIEQRNKYFQCLKEIKDLLSQVDENNWLHTGKHIYMDDRCISELKTRIQDKISECIGVEE